MAIVINGSGTITGVSAGGLPDDIVDAGMMADNSIDSDAYVDASIDAVHLSANSVDSDAYVDASIDNAHLADDAVGVAELSATGTASSSTFLRGDNSWQTAGASAVNDLSDGVTSRSGVSEILGIGNNVLDSTTGGGWHTAFGINALTAETTGVSSVAVGFEALKTSTTGGNNTALGTQALKLCLTHSGNTAVGASALYNTVASYNTAVGYTALISNTGGQENTAVGYYSLNGNTEGNQNVAMGKWALNKNTTGHYNVSIGAHSMNTSTTGERNNAVGNGCLLDLTTADGNNAMGYYAAANITTGEYSVIIGHHAGYEATEGDNNILIGKDSGRSTAPSGTVTTGGNVLCLGDNNILSFYCADTSISSSDQRDKTDIENFTAGLSFVNQMRPVTYRWDKRSSYLDDDNTDVLAITPDGTHKKPKQNIGFLSQEIEALEQEIGFSTDKNNQLFCNTNEDDTAMGLKYERLVPVLVNAIQELSTQNEALSARILTLENA